MFEEKLPMSEEKTARTAGEWFYQPIDGRFEIYENLKYRLEIADLSISKFRSFEEQETNAEFICLAVNNHDALVEALEEMSDLLENEDWVDWKADTYDSNLDHFDIQNARDLFEKQVEKAKEVLARAKGEK